MDVELIILVGKVAGAVVSIGGAIRYFPKAYRWIRSWSIIKGQEVDRLRKLAAKYEKNEADLKSLQEFCAPFLAQKRAELVREFGKQSEKEQQREMDRELANDIRSKVKRLSDYYPESEVDSKFDSAKTFKAKQPNKEQEYQWATFLWLLKEQFWLNCDQLSENQAGNAFLETAIHGPLCIECKRDLSKVIEAGSSVCACSRKFKLPRYFHEPYPAERLRREAYAEAQAAVRRKELQK